MSNFNKGNDSNRQSYIRGSQRSSDQSIFKIKLPDNYLKEGYFDPQGVRHRELYFDWAVSISESLKTAKMTSTALRKYFNQAKQISRLVEADSQRFEQKKHELLLLKAKVFNAAKKKRSNTPMLMHEFIEKNVREAEKSLINLTVFIDHFECIVAYFKE